MKKIPLLILLSVFTGATQRPLPPYPDLNTYAVENDGYSYFGYSCSSWETLFEGCGIDERKVRTEVPPWIIAGGWRTYFMTDGLSGYTCSSPASLIGNTGIDIKNNGVGPYNVSTNYFDEAGLCPGNALENWKRTYYGIYSAQYFNHPSAGNVSLGFLHAENKEKCCPSPGHPPAICSRTAQRLQRE